MVTRPVFSPEKDSVGVKVENSAPFVWNPGFSPSQKKKNVVALHEAIRKSNPEMRPLEVSSKSERGVGVALSAFNLGTMSNGKFYSVESVFQASKVFAGGIGPFPELYEGNPAEVRAKVRELAKSPLVAFKTGDVVWDLNPTRAFYDWVYCRALHRNPVLVEELAPYNCFTDVEFNPVRSLNCQAYAVALYLSLAANGVLDAALERKEAFLEFHPADVVNLKTTNSFSGKSARKVKSAVNSRQMELL